MRLALLVLLLLWAAPSHAAYTLVQWDWSQGSGGSIDGFHVKCGRSPGVYTVTTTVTDTAARSVSIYTATNNERGQWYCTVDAYSTSNGVSANGNEVNFVLQLFDGLRRRFGFGFGF